MRSRRGAARSVAAPFPARHALPSLRLGWAAAPALACRGVPPAPLPVASVLAAPLAQGSSRALSRPCARLRCSPSAPAPPLLARVSGALRGVLAPLRLGRRARCGWPAGPPLPRPRVARVRPLSLPRGDFPARGLRRAFLVRSSPPRGLVGGAAAAPSFFTAGEISAFSFVALPRPVYRA